MDSIKNNIIDYITINRISTTEVADCLGKSGALAEVIPCVRGLHEVGEIQWVYAYNESNWSLHEQIQDIPEDKIVLVDEYACNDRALFGELVSKYLLLYKQSRAIVANGRLRDAAALLRQGWSIWCKGYTPIGCFNAKPDVEVDKDWEKSNIEKYDGAIAVCDDCGVVVIDKDNLTEELLVQLQKIEEQEDIWFDRLDHYKENTFEIVCKKNYFKDEEYLRIRNKGRR